MIATKERGSNKIKFFSVTPDELAFVNFSKYCGFEFEGKQTNTGNYLVKTPFGDSNYNIKFSFPFNSER